MQTLQIDKLGTGVFDGATLLDPAMSGATIETLSSENRTILTIPNGVAVGQINIRSILNIPAGRSIVIYDASIAGDFAGSFTGGNLAIVGPIDPTGASRNEQQSPLIGTSGLGFLRGNWIADDDLLGITTIVADTGPYRLVLLIEDIPSQKLANAIMSGRLSA